MPPLTCIAHRGGYLDRDNTPENSLAAIRHSLALGVDAIEIDIWQAHEQIWVTHDRRLGRLYSGTGLLCKQPLNTLRSLTLGNGESIPTLPQVLKLVGDQCLVNIEIKGPNCIAQLIKELTHYCNNSSTSLDNYLVSSFDQRQLLQLKRALPRLKRGVLLAGLPLDQAAQCEPLEPHVLGLHIAAVDQAMISDAHQRGYLVWVYTINYSDDWQALSELGVDGVFTDTPQKLQAFNGALL
jgi:glycerophosphoryl diester phosphodiesterase